MHNGRVALHPNPSPVFGQKPEIFRCNLPLVEYCEKHNKTAVQQRSQISGTIVLNDLSRARRKTIKSQGDFWREIATIGLMSGD